ncbi:TPA_asm: integrase [Monoraphidium MELD virus]|nr:TPA_asm: integrase [Monoraphidium MELD virus]
MEKLQGLLEKAPRLKYLGKTKLQQELRGQGIPGKVLDEYFAQSDLRQVFKGVDKRPAELNYKITAQPRSFQLDVVHFGFAKRRGNKGCAQALLAVDILSRKAWLYPLKARTMADILGQYEAFLRAVGVSSVKALQTRVKMVMADDEFAAKQFAAFNEALGIAVYTDIAKDDHISHDSDRLGILDRLVGTLKRQLEMRYVEAGVEGDWLKFIPDIVVDYNDTVHRTLGVTPNQAWAAPESEQLERYSREVKLNEAIDDAQQKYAPGARVRILENASTFTKGTKPRWSLKVYAVKDRDGYKYLVEGLTRRFKPNELQPAGEGAQDLSVDKTPAKQEKARKKITSRKEGIAVDEPALQGRAAPRQTRERKERRTLQELDLKAGEFVVLDAEGEPEGPERLSVKQPRRSGKTGYVTAGWVARKARGAVFLRLLRGQGQADGPPLGGPLVLSEEDTKISSGTHADALLYRSTGELQRQQQVKLPASITDKVLAEYVFV